MNLVSFRMSNYLCFRDEVIFTMEPQARVTSDKRNLFGVGRKENLLKLSLIYGANATGKTSLLDGMFSLRAAVSRSHYEVESEKSYDILPHFSCDPENDPTELEIEFYHNDQLFKYGFSYLNGKFIEEWLVGYPKTQAVTYFRILNGGEEYTFSDYLPGKKVGLIRDMRPDKLLISSAAANGHEYLTPIFKAITDDFSFYSIESRPDFVVEAELAKAMEEDPKLAKFVSEVLHQADTGIQRVIVVEDKFDLYDDERLKSMFKEDALEILKRSAPKKDYSLIFEHKSRDGFYPLTLSVQSEGTKYLLQIAYWLFKGIRDGKVCVLDELGGSLHEDVAAAVIRMFQSTETNRENAQIIASTHCSALMDLSIRSDQIWFTTKNEFGESDLVPLSDFKPRSDENVRRKYKLGHYGGVPLQQNFEF